MATRAVRILTLVTGAGLVIAAHSIIKEVIEGAKRAGRFLRKKGNAPRTGRSKRKKHSGRPRRRSDRRRRRRKKGVVCFLVMMPLTKIGRMDYQTC
jgi:hypothetical protein